MSLTPSPLLQSLQVSYEFDKSLILANVPSCACRMWLAIYTVQLHRKNLTSQTLHTSKERV